MTKEYKHAGYLSGAIFTSAPALTSCSGNPKTQLTEEASHPLSHLYREMATMVLSVRPSVGSLASSSCLQRRGTVETSSSFLFRFPSLQSPPLSISWSQSAANFRRGSGFLVACLPPAPKSASRASTRLYVSGLSFRTTKESLRNAFQNFGQLIEVTLVMDRIANRPRGFAFLRYATEEESRKAIEGMHGKIQIINFERGKKYWDRAFRDEI
ncbi:uncharacterized protein [Elaeis guineensis]|uniref:uncharacterized protein isoform X3 n=1 Tax=Elaeis guineensis var. tenera TaxID=51953 RepID=UPI003C6D71A6